MAVGFLLAVQQGTIDAELKQAASSRDERKPSDLRFKRFLRNNLCQRAHGTRSVASFVAVNQLDFKHLHDS